MRKIKYFILLILLLSVVFFILLSPYTVSPELYTIEIGAYTPLHSNPEALKQISQEKTDEMLPQMQDALDSTGMLTLNVKFKDFEEAKSGFEGYSKSTGDINGLVINLDLSESEIGKFREANDENLESLKELLNDTIRFEELNELKIQYRDENNPSKLYSVVYEGEALKKKINENFLNYRDRSNTLVEIGNIFELNTTEHEKSVLTFKEIVESIITEQTFDVEKYVGETSKTPPSYLQINLSPEEGYFGDTIFVSGKYVRANPENKTINLYIDSREKGAAITGEDGNYNFPVIIEKIRSGIHFVYTSKGSICSEILQFTVFRSDSALTLNCSVNETGRDVLFYGRLTGRGNPVLNAPVDIYIRAYESAGLNTSQNKDDDLSGSIFEPMGVQVWDFPAGENVLLTTLITRDDGYYEGSFSLPEGRFSVQAFFSGKGYPLNGSKSEIIDVEVKKQDNILLKTAIILLFSIVSCSGAWYYLRKKKRSDVFSAVSVKTDEKEGNMPGEPGADAVKALYDIDSVKLRYQTYIDDSEYYPAARLLSTSLFDQISHSTGVKYLPYMTVRERIVPLTDTPLAESLREFSRRYEIMAYSAIVLSTAESEQLFECWTVIFEDLTGGKY